MTNEHISIPINCAPSAAYAFLGIYTHEAAFDLDPEEVSTILGIRASHSQTKGQMMRKSKIPALSSSWRLSSKDFVKSTEANQHLEWILDQLCASHSTIRMLKARKYRIEMWLSIHIDHWNTMCTLEPETLRRLATLSLPLRFDIYDYQGWKDE